MSVGKWEPNISYDQLSGRSGLVVTMSVGKWEPNISYDQLRGRSGLVVTMSVGKWEPNISNDQLRGRSGLVVTMSVGKWEPNISYDQFRPMFYNTTKFGWIRGIKLTTFIANFRTTCNIHLFLYIRLFSS